MKHFFPEFKWTLRSDAHQSQIIGGMQMYIILKLLGGYSQIIGGYIPPSRVSAPLVLALATQNGLSGFPDSLLLLWMALL